jgi:hypothetical protein
MSTQRIQTIVNILDRYFARIPGGLSAKQTIENKKYGGLLSSLATYTTGIM